MYERILLPTDGGDPATVAADHALELASTYDATLYVVYVLKTNEPPPGVHDPPAEADPDTQGDAAIEAVTDRAVDRGIEVVQAVLRGPTAEAIVTNADDNDVDLIVMGTHARTGINRILSGSVSADVTRKAGVPVMTYHPPDD